jgi:hypothetical protein
MSKDSDGKNYKVGYGAPPEETKYKPGQSGNKKGRPKKEPLSMNESAYVAVASELVTIKLNGKKTTVTAEHAVWLKIRQGALSGDARAQKIWVQAWQTAVKYEVIKPVKSPGLLPNSKFVWTEEIKKSVDEAIAYVETKGWEKDEPVDAHPAPAASPPLDPTHDVASVTSPSDATSDGLDDNQSSTDG